MYGVRIRTEGARGGKSSAYRSKGNAILRHAALDGQDDRWPSVLKHTQATTDKILMTVSAGEGHGLTDLGFPDAENDTLKLNLDVPTSRQINHYFFCWPESVKTNSLTVNLLARPTYSASSKFPPDNLSLGKAKLLAGVAAVTVNP